MFGSSQESLQEVVEEDNENKKGFADTARGVRDRLARTGTTMSRRASLRLSITPQNSSNSRLSLVQESGSVQDLEDSERIADQIKEKAFHDSLAAINHVSSPVDEDMHVDAIASPIRRRSLYTPGLATRVPNDILRKPPQPEERVESEIDRDYYYNPKKPESSPLSKLAALERVEHGRSSPIPRASTPADRDYGHLGGLRLGTLRITNGDSSPVPRIRSPVGAGKDSSPDLEDYFNTVDGIHSDEEGEELGTTELISRAGRLPWVVADSEKARRIGSPLRRQLQPVLSPEQANSTDNSLKQPRPQSMKAFSTPDYSLKVAEDYMSELPESPYSTSGNLLAHAKPFAPTSKANEFDDKLFDDDNELSLSSRKQSIPTAYDNDQYQNCDRLATPASSPSQVDINGCPTYSEAAPERPGLLPLPKNPELLNSNLAKADSGYSSTTSSKSSKRRTFSSPGGNAPLRSAMRSSLKVPISPGGPRETPQNDLNMLPPSRPPPPIPSVSAVPSFPLGNENSSSSIQRSSLPVPTVVLTPSTTSGTLCEPRKLKKLRPLSLPQPVNAIVVQSHREIDQSNIPPVCPNVASRHEERLRYFPSLEHTFPSSQHTGLRESHSSPDLVFVPIRFPSPAHDEGEDYFSLPVYNTANTPSISNKKTSKPEYRLSLNHQLGDFSIADFGDVTESLGGSTYDVARSTLNPISQAYTTMNTNTTHPHHETSLTPRRRGGMDEEQAAMFARMRSQERNQSFTATEIATISPNLHTDPDESIQQPARRSMDYPTRPPPPPPVPSKDLPSPRTTFNDRGGVPGKMPKSRSAALPPLPLVSPRAQFKQPEEVFRSVSTHSSADADAQPSPQMHTCSRCGNTELINPSPNWDAQRQAWSDRRKSANEGLQNTKSSESETQNRVSAPASQSPLNKATAAAAQWSSGQTLQVPQEQANYHPPPTPPHSPRNSNNSSTASLKDNFTSSEGNVQRHSGRFEGGLAFGYEPGYGLGGSAGTRGMKTDASRKSVEVSRGYGIDLSDVPIFVAPSM